MSAYARFLIASLRPLMAAALGVALVSAVYLINDDHWMALRFGFFFILLSKLLVPYLLLPGGVLMGLVKMSEREQPRLSLSLYIICLLYFTTLMTGSAYLLLMPVAGFTHGASGFAAIGWFLGSTVFPWAVLAHADRQNAVFIEMIWMLALSAVTMVLAAFYIPHAGGGMVFLAGWAQMATLMLGKAMYEHLVAKRAA